MNIKIQYSFIMNETEKEIIDLEIDSETGELQLKDQGNLPDWTRLEFNQCSNCPLKPESVPHCPVAVNINEVINRFNKIFSSDHLNLVVRMEDRDISLSTTAQRGLSSIIGLLFATSTCPHTSFLKPMARFHKPLASIEETIFRVTSMYLLGQYFSINNSKEIDIELDGLKKYYQNLHLINSYIVRRLRSIAQTDSSINAIVVLDTFTNFVPSTIDQKLIEFKKLFSRYM